MLVLLVVVKASMYLGVYLHDKQKMLDGTITVDETSDEKIVWNIKYDGDPYELQKRDTVTFKIKVKG